MNFEDMQKAWQSQDPGINVTISADTLLKEVRRNQRQFRATIFWRDVKEIGVAIFLTLFFCYSGFHRHDWTFIFCGLGAFAVAAFMIGDRLVQLKKKPVSNDPLKACIESSLLQVVHQIWLLKNILWWYLLPLAIPLAISTAADIWRSRHHASALMGWAWYALFSILLFWGIYWVNQFAVRKSLEPRRRELESLSASLQ